MKFDQFEHEILAALIWHRFGKDHGATIEAWKRLLQNSGWDESPVTRSEFIEMIAKGDKSLRTCGIVPRDDWPK